MMCELFPELDRDIARHVLRDGILLEDEDAAVHEALQCLQSLGLAVIREHKYVRCAYRDDYDFFDREALDCPGRVALDPAEEDYYCPECGQPIGDIEQKTVFVEYEVGLSSVGIEKYLGEILRSLEEIEAIEKVGRATFDVQMQGGMPLTVVVPDYAEIHHKFAGLFFAEPTLYVIASPIDDPVRTVLEETQYVGLWEILCESVDVFGERVSVAATPVYGRRDLSDVEAGFDEMLERHRSHRWQFFEHDFIPAFVQHVTEHPGLSQQYLGRLRRLGQTVFGKYYIPIGGSGVTDLRGIDKYELMIELFEGEFIGDAKCYVDSTLEYDKLTSVNAHLDTDPTNPRRAVVFVAGNDISSTSWDFAIRLRDRWGYWRLAIIPKYLLLEMISELDAVRLLDM